MTIQYLSVHDVQNCDSEDIFNEIAHYYDFCNISMHERKEILQIINACKTDSLFAKRLAGEIYV